MQSMQKLFAGLKRPAIARWWSQHPNRSSPEANTIHRNRKGGNIETLVAGAGGKRGGDKGTTSETAATEGIQSVPSSTEHETGPSALFAVSKSPSGENLERSALAKMSASAQQGIDPQHVGSSTPSRRRRTENKRGLGRFLSIREPKRNETPPPVSEMSDSGVSQTDKISRSDQPLSSEHPEERPTMLIPSAGENMGPDRSSNLYTSFRRAASFRSHEKKETGTDNNYAELVRLQAELTNALSRESQLKLDFQQMSEEHRELSGKITQIVNERDDLKSNLDWNSVSHEESQMRELTETILKEEKEKRLEIEEDLGKCLLAAEQLQAERDELKLKNDELLSIIESKEREMMEFVEKKNDEVILMTAEMNIERNQLKNNMEDYANIINTEKEELKLKLNEIQQKKNHFLKNPSDRRKNQENDSDDHEPEDPVRKTSRRRLNRFWSPEQNLDSHPSIRKTNGISRPGPRIKRLGLNRFWSPEQKLDSKNSIGDTDGINRHETADRNESDLEEQHEQQPSMEKTDGINRHETADRSESDLEEQHEHYPSIGNTDGTNRYRTASSSETDLEDQHDCQPLTEDKNGIHRDNTAEPEEIAPTKFGLNSQHVESGVSGETLLSQFKSDQHVTKYLSESNSEVHNEYHNQNEYWDGDDDYDTQAYWKPPAA